MILEKMSRIILEYWIQVASDHDEIEEMIDC
jgi:hypothetical protein